MLGASLDDQVETRLWQKHRDAGWEWPATQADQIVNFIFDAASTSGAADAREVTLACSLSAEVNPNRTPGELQGLPRLTPIPFS